jgi:hypothetical protein
MLQLFRSYLSMNSQFCDSSNSVTKYREKNIMKKELAPDRYYVIMAIVEID